MEERPKRNIWNFINLFGVIATFVFGLYGIFFVPLYVKNAYKERQDVANIEIVNDIKEIIYSNLSTDSMLIPTLKKGKELKYDIIFPRTNNEIIVEVQEDFMSDKFLPLDERIKLYKKADSLMLILPVVDQIQISKPKRKSSIFLLLNYSLSILSIITSLVIFFRLYTRKRKEIEEDVEQRFEEMQETSPKFIYEYRNFESLVGQALHELKLEFEDYTKNPKDSSFDFVIKLGSKKIGLEVKSYVKSDYLIKLKNLFDTSGLNALIIVTNKVADFKSFSMFSEFQRDSKLAGRKIYFISAYNIEMLKSELTLLLRTEKE